jgi:hypothetical protein
MHRLLGQQNQRGSADITTLHPASATSLTSDGMASALEAAFAAVSSFVVHRSQPPSIEDTIKITRDISLSK